MVWNKSKIIKILKEQNYRITKTRLKIIDIIIEAKHVTIRSIIKKLVKQKEKFNIMTIYNTVELLLENSVLIANNFNGKNKLYELAYEPSIHATCKLCNTNIHFDHDKALNYKKKHDLNKLLKDMDWQPVYIKIDFQGICKKCKK